MNFRLKPNEDVNVIVGTNRWDSGGTAYKVQKFITHEKFEERAYAFDIGLIRVQNPIRFTKFVKVS